MMNRDPYHFTSSPSSIIMPFGLDQYNWDHTQVTQPSFDPPLALPLGPTTSNFPFYSPHHLAAAAAAEYPASTFMGIKWEDGGGGGSRPIGLNLGHRTYFSSGDAMSIDRLLSARAAQHHHHHHHQQPPRCQAEGCKADLSGAKHYHRRHKVCEFHSKATVVVAGGIQQRFCQQCSRFHVLSEFDESKRSCRKRLADHNRRRRKPHNNNNNINSSSSSADKTKPNIAPPRPSGDSNRNSSKCTTTTSTATTTTTTSNGGFEGNQGEQGKAILFRNGAALSLGGRTQQQQQQHHQGVYSNNYNTSTAATGIYNHHHQSLQFGSTSSNDASHQSTGAGDGSGPDQHQHQTNLLHLGQAMFQADFM